MFRKAKYYRDCSELKMSVFYRILKSWDSKLLRYGELELLCYEWKPNIKECERIWDSIEREYEKETATPEYYYQLSENNHEFLVSIRINGLILLYWKKKLAPERDCSTDELFWDVQGYDAEAIHSLILQEITRLSVRKLQDKERQELKEKGKQRMTIDRLKLAVEEWLNKDYIDFDKVSVIEWIRMVERAKEKSELAIK